MKDTKKTVLIWSNKWSAYWKPNSNGYTDKIEEAGLYDIDRAKNVVNSGHGRDSIKYLTPELINIRDLELTKEDKELSILIDEVLKRKQKLFNLYKDFFDEEDQICPDCEAVMLELNHCQSCYEIDLLNDNLEKE